MAKRKKVVHTKSSKILTYIAWILAILALCLTLLVGGYYFGYTKEKEDAKKQNIIEKEKRLAVLKKAEEATKYTQSSVNDRLKEVLKKESAYTELPKHEVLKNPEKEYSGAAHELDDASVSEMPYINRDIQATSKKARLAIIIDDVSITSHINAIKSLGIPITMSFLPPRAARPDSAKLAAKESFYMVHLPMEAQSFSKEEPFTLHTDDSQSVISKRIKELKKLFPRVHYINNHTGSKFTSDELAMNRLIFSLKKEGINFIDSRTSSQTKAPKVMSNFGLKYVARDVFLDHHADIPYIKEQIKVAIKLAKLHGNAIAIGHPHANTILALNESKKLLRDVELVYVNKLY